MNKIYKKIMTKKAKEIKICLELNKTVDCNEVYYFDNENNLIDNIKDFDKIVKIKVVFSNLIDLLKESKKLEKKGINYCVK